MTLRLCFKPNPATKMVLESIIVDGKTTDLSAARTSDVFQRAFCIAFLLAKAKSINGPHSESLVLTSAISNGTWAKSLKDQLKLAKAPDWLDRIQKAFTGSAYKVIKFQPFHAGANRITYLHNPPGIAISSVTFSCGGKPLEASELLPFAGRLEKAHAGWKPSGDFKGQRKVTTVPPNRTRSAMWKEDGVKIEHQKGDLARWIGFKTIYDSLELDEVEMREIDSPFVPDIRDEQHSEKLWRNLYASMERTAKTSPPRFYPLVHLCEMPERGSARQKLRISVEPTFYALFHATNLNPAYCETITGNRFSRFKPRFFACPLACIGMVVSSDQYTFVRQRSFEVSESRGMMQASFGGSMTYKSPASGHGQGRVESVRETLQREVLEETGLWPTEYQVKSVAFGISLQTFEPDFIIILESKLNREQCVKRMHECGCREFGGPIYSVSLNGISDFCDEKQGEITKGTSSWEQWSQPADLLAFFRALQQTRFGEQRFFDLVPEHASAFARAHS